MSILRLHLCAMIVVTALSAAASTQAQVLFSDTFDRPNTTSISSPSTGMGGVLAPLNYFETPNAEIDTGVLRLGIGSPTGDYVFPDHDFIDSSLAAAGGFMISFDVSPSPSTDNVGNADWAAVSIGYARSDATATGQLKVIGTKAFGVLFRGSGGTSNPGQLQMFSSGSTSLGAAVYDQSPTPRESYHVAITVTPNAGQTLFAAGQTATADITVTGQLGLTAGQQIFEIKQAFSWVGPDNYILFEGIGPDPVTTGTSTFDNISISTVPEPSCFGLIFAGTIGIYIRRRRHA